MRSLLHWTAAILFGVIAGLAGAVAYPDGATSQTAGFLYFLAVVACGTAIGKISS